MSRRCATKLIVLSTHEVHDAPSNISTSDMVVRRPSMEREGRVNYEKAHAKAAAQLHPGERELTATKASLKPPGHNITPGALVLTDQRLIFVGGLMGIVERASLSIPLASITSIDSHGAVVGFTTIAMGGAQHRFLSLPEPFVRYLHEVRAWRVTPQVPAQPPAVPVPTRVDELERLAKLREQGILTDEEFAAEKLRLLG